MKLSDMNDFIWHFKNTYLQLFCQSNIKKWANTESPMTVKWDWSDLCILRCDFARGGGLRALWNRMYPRNITDFMLYKSVRFLVVNRDLLEALHQVQLWLLNSFFVKEQWELEEKLNGLILLIQILYWKFLLLEVNFLQLSLPSMDMIIPSCHISQGFVVFSVPWGSIFWYNPLFC